MVLTLSEGNPPCSSSSSRCWRSWSPPPTTC